MVVRSRKTTSDSDSIRTLEIIAVKGKFRKCPLAIDKLLLDLLKSCQILQNLVIFYLALEKFRLTPTNLVDNLSQFSRNPQEI